MLRGEKLETAKRLAKWTADKYFELGVEDLDWVANELVRIDEEIRLLQKRQRELWAKQMALQESTKKGLETIIGKLTKAKPKAPFRRL